MTLGNAFCGCLAIVSAAVGKLDWAFYFVLGGALLDFLDGFAARLLGAAGELGKQLDSLSDAITFGAAPGVIMFKFTGGFDTFRSSEFSAESMLTLSCFLLPVFGVLRLARFNIDTRQSDSFIGLPIPAMAIFFISIPMIFSASPEWIEFPLLSERWFYFGLCLLFGILMNVELPLFAMKFKSFGFKGNEIRFMFLILVIVSISLSILLGNIFVSAPIIILLYLILSVINNLTKKNNAI